MKHLASVKWSKKCWAQNMREDDDIDDEADPLDLIRLVA